MAKKNENNINENVVVLNNAILKENEELKKQVILLKEYKEKLEQGIKEEREKYNQLKKEKVEKQTKIQTKENMVLIRLNTSCGVVGFEIDGKFYQTNQFGNAIVAIREEDLEKNNELKKRCSIIANKGEFYSLI